MDGPLSKYMESGAPQPTQAALDRILGQVAKVRVYAGGMNWDRPAEATVLAETADPLAVEDLKKALRIEDGPAGHCMCDGEPTLELLGRDGKPLAVLGMHHGISIRWSEWKDDAQLVQGMDLLMWLAGEGVSEPLDEFLADAAERDAAAREWNEWLGAMPEPLRALPQETWTKVTGKGDLFPLLAALVKGYPDIQARALAVLQWHGCGGPAWSGYPSYERLSAAVLAQFPEQELVRIAEAAQLTTGQLYGAARFFACNEPGRSPGLPSALGPTSEVISGPIRKSPLPAITPGLCGRFLEACVQCADGEALGIAEAAYLEPGDRDFVTALHAAYNGRVVVMPSETRFAQNTQPAVLAAFLARADAALPKDVPVMVRFEARPAADLDIRFAVPGSDEEQAARRQAVSAAIPRLPRFNTSLGALVFFARYPGGE